MKDDRIYITYEMSQDQFFGDYYLFHNLKSEFVYIAKTPVTAFSLSKKFLIRNVFNKMWHIFNEIKEQSKLRYSAYRGEIIQHKVRYMEILNKRTVYEGIQLTQKEIIDQSGQLQMLDRDSVAHEYQNVINSKISSMKRKMNNIENKVVNFVGHIDFNYQQFQEQLKMISQNI